MDINYLKTLKTILDTGTFQNAANKLGYTQSTISFHVRQLEQVFDVILFEKVGRKMVFTQAGRAIMPKVDAILNLYNEILEYSKANQGLSGELHIAMPESLLVYRMQPLLTEFRKMAPDISLSLHSHSCYTINNYILNGEVDIGIQYDVEGYTGNVVEEQLENIDLAFVGSKFVRDEGLETILSTTPFITSNDSTDACRVIATDYLRKEKIHVHHMMELGSIEAIKRSVVNDLGIAYLPKHTVEEELQSGSLIELESEITNKVVTVICVYHKNKWLTPAMKLFIELAKTEKN